MLLYYFTSVSRVALFWAAFILTRPLGATVSDFLDKAGRRWRSVIELSAGSAIIEAFIPACVLVLPQRAGQHPA